MGRFLRRSVYSILLDSAEQL